LTTSGSNISVRRSGDERGVTAASGGSAGRRDARANRERILTVAAELLRGDPDVTVDEVAAAAGVGRATLYRHFTSRSGLAAALRAFTSERSDANVRDALRPPGELASAGPVPLDVADVLNKVPPHLLAEQIVAEAQRLAGIRSVVLYLIDIDGTRLQRAAGSQEFPDEIRIPCAVGPEIPREAMPALRRQLDELLPASTLAPMFLRGRAVGVLIAVDAPEAPLLELARQAAAAMALADGYTDTFDATRRHKDISAASEIQQNLLPPRIARIAGGLLAGNVLPGYEIGGDWFDYVENPDGAWIATADSAGSGTTAAAIGAITLGAFRAKRRRGATLGETVRYMEQILHELDAPSVTCNAIIARWHGPSGSFFWIACGDLQPCLIDTAGRVTRLPGTSHPSLGLLDGGDQRMVAADAHRLAPDERILLISDGVTAHSRSSAGAITLADIGQAIAALSEARSAPAIVSAIADMLGDNGDPLDDDATIVAFSPTDP
jgi:AcrR family transcriptional regulator